MNTIIFEDIKHIDEEGNEYWYARELMIVLEYKKWQNFKTVIGNAKISCINSNISLSEQFTEVSKPLVGGNGNIQNVLDYRLSRYACYLITQTDSKLKRDNVDNEYEANLTHYKVGKEVRDSIKRMKGTMPEDLPTPKSSIKDIDNKKIE